MGANAQFALQVDVPFPLNVTPRPVIEATGNAAVNRVLRTLLLSLCQSIVADHAAWLASVPSKAPQEDATAAPAAA